VTLDLTIPFGHILTVLGGVGTIVASLWRLHRCLERRLDGLDRHIGGSRDDKPISEQIAVLQEAAVSRHQQMDLLQQAAQERYQQIDRLTQETAIRHQENKQRFKYLRRTNDETLRAIADLRAAFDRGGRPAP
jgi:hypothetical protein